ncbi:MAG TPA: hypothetical protein VM122_07415 [Usitatibacter sp.]|nr:hypothetical protein [Usitatibacter sp.]
MALATFAWPSAAVVLGEAQVRSALGEPLDVVIPLKPGPAESIERACFTLPPGNEAGLPDVGPGSVSIERSRGAAALRLRSFASVLEPAVAMRVRTLCPGATSESVREYVLLLDPRPSGAVPAAAPAAEAAPPRGVIATILARIGDTLESLARALIPRSSSARRDYIAAMRAANPQLQSLGENEPIPEGTSVALPDMRLPAIARTRPREEGSKASPAADTPAPVRAAAPRKEAMPAPPRREPRAAPAPEHRETRAAPAPQRREPARAREPGFVLRLSNAEVDMSRSSRFDEPARQKLRERQLVLDADDQVSALLAMRNSLKQLETRVAELQLKLAAMPPSLAGLTPPAEKAAPAPAPREAQAVKPAPAPEKVAPPPVIAPPVPEPAQQAQPAPVAPVAPQPAATPQPPPPVAVTPEPSPPPPVSSAPPDAPATQAPQAATAEPPAASAEKKPASRAVARPASIGDSLTPWLWLLVALLVALALWLALRISQRKRAEREETGYVEPEMGAEAAVVEYVPDEPVVEPEPAPRAVARVQERAAMASDASLATRFAENSGELRRRYIEERFPEIANGAIALDDPASVVKGARLFYEDGALPRAVELLQFAIEDRPREVKPWLALFEIFRLERLAGEYAALAARFQQQHGDTAEWRKVRFFGREIDSGNALYKEDTVNTLETIGPREARKLAAAASNWDPIAENWLEAPMDFENEVLANDLRRALMAEAQLNDHDLLPNPMPALRNVEMFTVA